MIKNKNKISLYVPVYNAELYIAEVLEAVLNQELKFSEILVIDDASSDKTLDIVKRFPVKIIVNETNKGLAFCRNLALKNLQGDFIASIDADVVINYDWSKILMQCFKNQKIAGVGGKLIERESALVYDRWRKINLKQHFGDTFCSAEFLPGCNTIFRKDILFEVGLYKETYRNYHEDTDISARIKAKGYELLYEPKAQAFHIKCDNLYSLMRACFGFRYKKEELKLFKLFYFFIREFYHAFVIIIKDIINFNFDLLFIDILYAPFQIYFLIKNFRQ